MKNKKSKQFHKPLEGYSVYKTFLWHFINPKTAKHSFKFISEVWTNFFMIQQKQKFGRTKIPVVNVEHPLDDKIPFVPEKVGIYLDFVAFFIRILSMIKKSFPKSTRYQKCAEFEDFLSTLYQSASAVYNQKLTTTERPHYKNDFHFWVIYTFDPHFLCVPSLHIAIVAGSYAFVRKIFATDEAMLSDSEKKQILNEIYNGALNIAESVLFIKQHSINCVAGALYMLSALFQEDFFSETDAHNFVNNLFKNNDDILEKPVTSTAPKTDFEHPQVIDTPCTTSIAAEKIPAPNEAHAQQYIEESAKTEIRSYIINLYNKLMQENKSPDTPWQKPILNFLDGYMKG